jgi:divinyl chlorophyllide a 8-vinyl-reductase
VTIARSSDLQGMPNPQPSASDANGSLADARRVLVIGATGTIGRATVRALVERGHEVVCLTRAHAGPGGKMDRAAIAEMLSGATVRIGDPTDPLSLKGDGIAEETFDAVISCLASRTGRPGDAWSIDYRAHIGALAVAKEARIPHFILLSAICVQKPRLEFQKAKLAFERALVNSGLTYSIVRPTAFFKSLSGQVDRVRRGKPFLLFGDGKLTACKPISDADLGRYLADCLVDENRHNRILPIGGPGDAITPREQGETLFELLRLQPRFLHVPVKLLDAAIAIFDLLGRISPASANKAELARIGRYYATESMLVFDQATGAYDASATPSTGNETLFHYYRDLIEGGAVLDRGDHAVF